MTRTSDEIKKGLECCADSGGTCEECPYADGECRAFEQLASDALALIQQLQAENDRLTDEVCNAYNIRNEQLARIKQLEAELEDMTARYKIADDCTKKKGEMNEKLYAELSAVKAERDAAVKSLRGRCFECKHNKTSVCLICSVTKEASQ